jgi:single-strand DNA-binding protein
MSCCENKVQLIGNVVNVPKIYTTRKGKKVSQFLIATNESYQGATGESITKTIWHKMVVRGKIAEIAAKYLTKGSKVAIEGKLADGKVTDKKGVTSKVTYIEVSELLMLTHKNRD